MEKNTGGTTISGVSNIENFEINVGKSSSQQHLKNKAAIDSFDGIISSVDPDYSDNRYPVEPLPPYTTVQRVGRPKKKKENKSTTKNSTMMASKRAKNVGNKETSKTLISPKKSPAAKLKIPAVTDRLDLGPAKKGNVPKKQTSKAGKQGTPVSMTGSISHSQSKNDGKNKLSSSPSNSSSTDLSPVPSNHSLGSTVLSSSGSSPQQKGLTSYTNRKALSQSVSPLAETGLVGSPLKGKKRKGKTTVSSPAVRKLKLTSKISGNKKIISNQHPSYGDMVVEAIATLQDKHGSSRAAVVKYIRLNYMSEDKNINLKSFNSYITLAIKRALHERKIILSRGTGASGLFKVTSLNTNTTSSSTIKATNAKNSKKPSKSLASMPNMQQSATTSSIKSIYRKPKKSINKTMKNVSPSKSKLPVKRISSLGQSIRPKSPKLFKGGSIKRKKSPDSTDENKFSKKDKSPIAKKSVKAKLVKKAKISAAPTLASSRKGRGIRNQT